MQSPSLHELDELLAVEANPHTTFDHRASSDRPETDAKDITLKVEGVYLRPEVQTGWYRQPSGNHCGIPYNRRQSRPSLNEVLVRPYKLPSVHTTRSDRQRC